MNKSAMENEDTMQTGQRWGEPVGGPREDRNRTEFHKEITKCMQQTKKWKWWQEGGAATLENINKSTPLWDTDTFHSLAPQLKKNEGK